MGHFRHQRRVSVSPDSTIPFSHIQNDVIRIRNKVRRGTRPVERPSPISRVIRHLGVSYASLLAVVGLKRTWDQKLSSDLLQMRNNAFVGNTGLFDNEIDITIFVRFDFNIQAGNGDLLPVHLPPVWGATARTCGGTLGKRMEGLRTVLQLTLRARAAVRLCTGAVYSSDSSSANSSDKLNMPHNDCNDTVVSEIDIFVSSTGNVNHFGTHE